MEQIPVSSTDNPLSINLYVPLSWRKVDEAQRAIFSNNCNRTNEQVLRSILTLDDLQYDQNDESRHKNPELLRLELRVNLMNDLLRYFLAKQYHTPPSHFMSFDAQGCSWVTPVTDGISCGDLVVVECFLEQDFPRPLELLCDVTATHKTSLSETQIQCKHYGFSEPVFDLLEKLLFRHHRRYIAKINRNG